MPFPTPRDLWIRAPSPSPNLPNLDHLRIPDSISFPRIREQDCMVHIQLLELFLVTRDQTEAWARRNKIPEQSAWNFYINCAMLRLTQWFQRSWEKPLKNVIPPLDVMMVWYAMMMEPRLWLTFVRATDLPLDGWDWMNLELAMKDAHHGKLILSPDCKNACAEIYPCVDLLEAMDISIAFLQSPNPDGTTEYLSQLYMNPMTQVQFCGPNMLIKIHFDFQNAVHQQLNFGTNMMQFSWHRMDRDQGACLHQMALSLDRYERFMALAKFWPRLREGPAAYYGPMVPTLDIDLVWRTHMLNPEKYSNYCFDLMGEDLIHINSTLEPGRSPDLQRTIAVYQQVFKERYCLCFCWSCLVGRRKGRFPWQDSVPLFSQLRSAKGQCYGAGYRGYIDMAQKRCKKCGWHPFRQCKPRHSLPQEVSDFTRPPGSLVPKTKPTTRPSGPGLPTIQEEMRHVLPMLVPAKIPSFFQGPAGFDQTTSTHGPVTVVRLSPRASLPRAPLPLPLSMLHAGGESSKQPAVSAWSL